MHYSEFCILNCFILEAPSSGLNTSVGANNSLLVCCSTAAKSGQLSAVILFLSLGLPVAEKGKEAAIAIVYENCLVVCNYSDVKCICTL